MTAVGEQPTASAPAPEESWHAWNQRQLVRALGRVRDALERHAARATGGATPALAADASDEESSESALGHLVALFGLSSFERDVLMLCAGIELDGRIGGLCAAAHGDARRTHPTFSLALAALPGAHWSAVAPGSPLRRWRLIEITGDEGLTQGALRIDERVLHFLTGVDATDDRLRGIAEPVTDVPSLTPSHQAIARRIVALWRSGDPGGGLGTDTIVALAGDAPIERRAIAATACEAAQIRLWVLHADALPSIPAEVDALRRAWERESALRHAALIIEVNDAEPGEPHRGPQAMRFADGLSGVVMVSSTDRLRSSGTRSIVTLDVRKPTLEEQRQSWRDALGPAAEPLNGQVDDVVSHFRLGARSIHAVAADALARLSLDDDVAADRAIWDACRAQARPRLEELAQRIEATACWDDVVLPDADTQILRDIASHVRQRTTVYDRWGFAGAGGTSRGLGISAMFAGASGTGKTLAAEVIAAELRLDLYRIDLATIVSKYIGETEKNLRRIFDAAEEGGAVLLFDEADALFGKRTEVKDSHDRYANIEVSYLLQRMEAYRGLAILTTNMKSAIDAAFLRRIRFVVHFPFPDATQRAAIWRRIFPAATPRDGLAYDRLAQLTVAGGNIRNIALGAAFLAADAREPVRMEHILRAARAEYAKLERPLTVAETIGWG